MSVIGFDTSFSDFPLKREGNSIILKANAVWHVSGDNIHWAWD